MPLDPQITPLVELVNATAVSAPPLAEQTVEHRRTAYTALAALIGDGPTVASVTNGDIAGVDVRTYAEPDASGIILFFHGGGWTIGDLDTHDLCCRQLAVDSRATVISVDYRLAPEHPFPSGLDDCWTVFKALAGGDEQIAVCGDSAGGNFAAVIALMARDAGLSLAAQLLVYPGVDMFDDSPSMRDNAVGYVLTRETLEWFGEQYAPDPEDWRASPTLAASHEGVAPATIITAEFDPLRDQGARYAEVLAAAGVDVTLTNYDGQVHVFFQLGSYTDAGAQAIRQVADAARAAFD